MGSSVTFASVMRGRPAAVITTAVGIALLAFAVIELILGGSAGGSTAGRQWEMEPDQTAPVSEEEAAGAAVDYISIPGFESAVVAAGSETVSMHLYNPENNSCYFMISIYLPGNGGDELLYQSKLVSPGQELYEITLERPLEAGTYEAFVHYDTFTMDGTYTPLNGADVPFTLVAE